MKELTIEEIKKELDAGHEVELECVDEKGFLSDAADTLRCWREVVLSLDKIIVNSRSSSDNALFLHNARGTYIVDSALKYFRIKRPTPTFDDLIDVVVQAVKDGVLTNKVIKISDYLIEMNINGRDRLFNSENAEDGINFINSLYTETFVIEDIESLQKVKIDANGILANGSKFKVHRAHGQYLRKGKLYIEFESEVTNHASLEVLKGATVTQRKGDK